VQPVFRNVGEELTVRVVRVRVGEAENLHG